jgi:hypothetical protein
MEKEMNEDKQEPEIDFESLEEIAKDASALIPKMNVDVPTINESQEEKNLVSDEMLLGLYDEALTNIRKDREEASELMNRFADMAFNDGDGSTSTKEAVVNLFKMKTDLSDKIAKIADLATRVKLRERDTFPKYLAAHQNNTINIDAKRTPLSPEEKRKLIESENKKLGKK